MKLKWTKNLFELIRADLNALAIGDDFIDFCVNLLKRLNRRANKDNWQEQLSVIFSRHSEVDSWILRCSGFRKLNLQSRLNVFKVRNQCIC